MGVYMKTKNATYLRGNAVKLIRWGEKTEFHTT